MEKHVLVNRIFTNGLNIGLPLLTWTKKIAHEVNTHWLSSKKKVLGLAVSKEGHADNLLGHERTHHY